VFGKSEKVKHVCLPQLIIPKILCLFKDYFEWNVKVDCRSLTTTCS